MTTVNVRLLILGDGRYSATVEHEGHHEGGVDFRATSRASAVRYAKDLGKAVAKGLHEAVIRVHLRDLSRV